MDYTAENNLLIPSGAAFGDYLQDYAARDFRPKAGTAAVDPATASNSVAWVSR